MIEDNHIDAEISRFCKWPEGSARENSCAWPTCRCREEAEQQAVRTMATLIFRGNPQDGYEFAIVESGVTIVRKLTNAHVCLLATQAVEALAAINERLIRDAATSL